MLLSDRENDNSDESHVSLVCKVCAVCALLHLCSHRGLKQRRAAFGHRGGGAEAPITGRFQKD